MANAGTQRQRRQSSSATHVQTIHRDAKGTTINISLLVTASGETLATPVEATSLALRVGKLKSFHDVVASSSSKTNVLRALGKVTTGRIWMVSYAKVAERRLRKTYMVVAPSLCSKDVPVQHLYSVGRKHRATSGTGDDQPPLQRRAGRWPLSPEHMTLQCPECAD